MASRMKTRKSKEIQTIDSNIESEWIIENSLYQPAFECIVSKKVKAQSRELCEVRFETTHHVAAFGLDVVFKTSIFKFHSWNVPYEMGGWVTKALPVGNDNGRIRCFGIRLDQSKRLGWIGTLYLETNRLAESGIHEIKITNRVDDIEGEDITKKVEVINDLVFKNKD